MDADTRSSPAANLVGALTRRLPVRRWQASHWLGKALMRRAPFVGRVHGGALEVHPGEVASTSTFFTGFYEREVTMWCLELLRTRPPALVVDVGAHFGYYPLLLGWKSRGRTASIAFEPDPSNHSWLRRNLALNPALPVTAVQEAVGDRDGEVLQFEAARDGHNLWARVAGLGEGANEHAAATVSVPSTTLDGYLDRHGTTGVDLTLIDVEGYEARVLDGMVRGIADRRYRHVMVEFHPFAFEDAMGAIAGIAERFLAAGYTGHRFKHHTSPHVDKDASFYNLSWDASILGPLTFGEQTSWEHYLFSVPDDARETAPDATASTRRLN